MDPEKVAAIEKARKKKEKELKKERELQAKKNEIVKEVTPINHAPIELKEVELTDREKEQKTGKKQKKETKQKKQKKEQKDTEKIKYEDIVQSTDELDKSANQKMMRRQM